MIGMMKIIEAIFAVPGVGRYAFDAINNSEVSFTEWAVQYWPVKLMIPIGAALLALQGLSKLIKDIVFVTNGGRA